MADIHHRIHRTSEHDQQFLQMLIDSETKRQTKSKAILDERQAVITELNNDDTSAAYHRYVANVQEIIKDKSDSLFDAKQSEETARLVSSSSSSSLSFVET